MSPRRCGWSRFSHIASDDSWRKLTMEWVKAFLAHAEWKYGDRITAYILSGGGTSKWYEYDRGRSSRGKNAAWRAWCAAHGVRHGEVMPPETEFHRAANVEKVDYVRLWAIVSASPFDNGRMMGCDLVLADLPMLLQAQWRRMISQ